MLLLLHCVVSFCCVSCSFRCCGCRFVAWRVLCVRCVLLLLFRFGAVVFDVFGCVCYVCVGVYVLFVLCVVLSLVVFVLACYVLVCCGLL